MAAAAPNNIQVNVPRRELTTQNFPEIFTQMPVDQFPRGDRMAFSELIPHRYYFTIDRNDRLGIHYVCDNRPDLGQIKLMERYVRVGNNWEPSFRVARTHSYHSLHTHAHYLRFYDLARGFMDGAGHHFSLDPDSVVTQDWCIPIEAPAALVAAAVAAPAAPVVPAAAPGLFGRFAGLFRARGGQRTRRKRHCHKKSRKSQKQK